MGLLDPEDKCGCLSYFIFQTELINWIPSWLFLCYRRARTGREGHGGEDRGGSLTAERFSGAALKDPIAGGKCVFFSSGYNIP